jgi:diguanylate cyclase (GGDEF)-like protein
MIDLNFFKDINDKYGHAEGDVALIRVARALKMTCANFSNNKIIISRFGGDEFSVFLLSESNSLVNEYIERLDENIKYLKQADNAEYDIHLACGYYKYNKNMTIRNFMDLADSNLYENKRRYHIAHGRKVR